MHFSICLPDFKIRYCPGAGQASGNYLSGKITVIVRNPATIIADFRTGFLLCHQFSGNSRVTNIFYLSQI
jgi:hypothetical protein